MFLFVSLLARYSVQAELEDLSKTLMEIEQLQKDTSEEYEETKNLILESHVSEKNLKSCFHS